MKYYGENEGGKKFAEINGRIWEGYEKPMANEPCDCCVPGWMRKEMRRDGVIFWADNPENKSKKFYHDGSNPPTIEEWQAATS